jgi:cell division protein FtsW
VEKQKIQMNQIKNVDKTLMYLLFALVIFGLTMVASAGVSYSQTRFGDPYFFFKRQLFYGYLPGILIFMLATKINYNFWKKISFPLFILSIIFLILVFVPNFGNRVYGASRWLSLGPFSFQPSEMLKFSLILYLATWLESRAEKIKDFYEGTVPFSAIVAIISFLLVKQPDMGTLGVVVLISMAIYFISGASLKHILLMGFLGLLSLLILIKVESYRMDRLTVFLHPEIDPKGIGYQINQALLSIGSGGFWGLGLGHSLQKFNYLPEPVGDSIFAIIGEELGLLGASVLVLIFFGICARGLKIAACAPDRFSKLIATGIVSWIAFQAFINISAITGLVPLTGIPLPFVSYGGTSIIFLMLGMGILLNISKYADLK